MRPTYPTPKCHCWNVARDGHATDCVDTGIDVERLARALRNVGGFTFPSEVAAEYARLAEAGGPSRLASREEPTE